MPSISERDKYHLLNDLNEIQREIIQSPAGPVVVLAGAGSGKTRVLTYRIAYLLLYNRIPPGRILAMTFTNKAANEMKTRIATLLNQEIKSLWIGTFHSLFCRILRKEWKHTNFPRNFYIYDEENRRHLIQEIIKEKSSWSDSGNISRSVINYISRLKNHLVSPEEFSSEAQNPFLELIEKVYPEYNYRLKMNNAMDFDDLLIQPIYLFRRHPHILQSYQQKFLYILIDEFQDTNLAQYEAVKLLAQESRNLFVVGDDDQSIYGWRGAEIENILNFEQDYPEAKVYRLEQNYRSTQMILSAAQSVVQHNTMRNPKNLWSERKEGEKVSLHIFSDEREEARWIAQVIKKELYSHKKELNEFAVLYRTNAQSRSIEEDLRHEGIPYTIVGGVRFYDRKEIRDILAYLQIIVNCNNEVALRRIINFPPRGIGKTTLEKLGELALKRNISLYESISVGIQENVFTPKATAALQYFCNMIKKYNALQRKLSVTELTQTLIDELGIIERYKIENTPESKERIENIKELSAAIADFVDRSPKKGLQQFLEEVSLMTEIDTVDNKNTRVTLMTLHAAKGLEFPIVFITGLEDGLFPLKQTIDNINELEEERRLFYVGATRAQDKLHLSYARLRGRFGKREELKCSRFIEEIDHKYLDSKPPTTRKIPLSSKIPPYPKKRKKQTSIYKTGMRIQHSDFGMGTIEFVENTGDDTKLTIFFDKVGKKLLLARYAHLIIIQ